MSDISASFPDSHSRFSYLSRSSLYSQPSLPSLRSHDMTSTPASPTRPSPNDLQSHLYASFLQRKTADVALRISGSWNAVYRLHRVILIQAGYFQSLFTSGFSESRAKHSGHRADPEFIDIVFDDLNITRAAFEVCIARLYGGGPPLWISPSLIPTPTCPLTPVFASGGPDYTPQSSGSGLPASLDISSAPALPPGYHSATPRFLLSLLATATFLSIPSVASQALSAILRTVGPYTVVPYLNFALGRGIGPAGEVGLDDFPQDPEAEAAVGLEQVAELIREEDSSFESFVETPRREDGPAGDAGTSKDEPKHSHICGPNDTDSDTDAEYHEDGEKTSAETLEPVYYYGGVSDKVGEAAACWLTRWGTDMFRYEEQAAASESSAAGKAPEVVWSPAAHKVQWSTDRPGSAPPEMRGSRFGTPPLSRNGKSELVAPVIWRRGGLTARWVRGVLSADALFVRGEKERYEMARNVVETRRAARAKGVPGESEEVEEAEFERLFREGVYYANMHLDDLMTISKDISPSTGKPMVPLSVLQAAHWNCSTLYHRITVRTPGSSSPSLSPVGATKELGLAVSTADIPKDTVHPEERDNPFYPIPGDSSLRLGDSTGLEGASMDQLFDLGSAKKGANTNEANFFGLEQARRPASILAASSPNVSGKWTAHPPYRFAVEFWDVDALKEKSRLHSHTIWYAGSLYNVYVQVVRKKGIQLGIYLHRQSTVDPIPTSSAPVTVMLPAPPRDRSVIGRGASSSVSSARPPSLVASGSTIFSSSQSTVPGSPLARTSTTPTTPNSPARSALSSSLPSSPGFARSSANLHGSSNSIGSLTFPVTLPAMAPAVTPPQPYRDPRPAVSAYFTIACASATGASLTRFTSAPDVFSVSQSWGWKSSSLRAEEYLEVDAEGLPAAVVLPARREVSLRATVVLGVV